MHMYTGEAGAEGATTPPIVLLEGHCPLKNDQSCDAVLYLNFVV